MSKYVYTFGKDKAEGSAKMRELLSGKGAKGGWQGTAIA